MHWLSVGSSTAFPVGQLLSAAGTTLGLAALAAVVTTVLALPVAWLASATAARRARRWSAATYFGNALPGIVVALALVTVSIHFARPALPDDDPADRRVRRSCSCPGRWSTSASALSQAPPVLDEVAHGLGNGPLATLRRVTLPLIAPGLGAGAALVFLAVVTELTATLLLAPIGTDTLATEVLEREQHARVRSGGAVRGAHGAAVGARDVRC